MASNYDDVILQLSNFGLIVGQLQIGRIIQCKTVEDNEKRGRYCLHEVTLSGGDTALVGSYGIWHGSEYTWQKIELNKVELTSEQKAAIRERMAEDRKRAINDQKQRSEKAALQVDKAWRKLLADGDCDYLHSKGIAAYGIRFTKENAIAIPMLDTSGRIWGLQFILNKNTQKEKIDKLGGRNKIFWPTGCAKKSHFHLIGSPTNLLLIAEGYATAATLHAATGFAVAVAFDANNLAPVAKALKSRYNCHILICADDDALAYCAACSKPININLSNICPECHQPHKKHNDGSIKAELAALGVSGRVIAPRFSVPAARLDYYARSQGKHTDFNDLHTLEGLHTVRIQVESALLQFGWNDAPKTRALTQWGSGADDKLHPIDTTDELLERFSLVYGKKGTVFDHKEHLLLALSDMRDSCQSRETHRRWQESPFRSIVRVENVGFDPGGQDPHITCNLWGGWPTTPKAGICDKLIGLLHHMCSGEDNAMDTAAWVIKWLAYPIQHPGAKMRTALVIHGPQGTGKNLFFEVIMAIYGRYGRIIDQPAIDDKHNDWASAKLFMIADEVVARSDLYHIKNKLKCFITGEWIRINPKNVAAYEERNHVNMVFLSNERMPVVIEEDDRRHCVIWTPPKKDRDYYKAINDEIENGGIEALHDWLLNIDLGEFDKHTSPPSTQAKDELLALSKDNVLRFYDDWIAGKFNPMRLINDDGLPNKDFIFIDSSKIPVLSEDLYEVYKIWCNRQGVRPSPMNKVIDHITKRPGVIKERSDYELNKQVSTSARSFIYPPQFIEKPEGIIKRKWLGYRITDFQTIISQYKTIIYD